MCGIAGIAGTSLSADEKTAAVNRMNDAMKHRGPDDRGIFARNEVALGNRRLAIFDPKNGHQPMVTDDGRYTLVFNGAIYNFRELRAELSPLGYTWRTECDTEVLLTAIVAWQEKALPKLRGMFAFACWDAQEKRLLLARDSFGIKPLYYHWSSKGGLVFASELDALFAAKLFTPEIDPRAIGAYLANFSVPAPQTIYRRVRCLHPGQYATWHDGNLSLCAYTDLQPRAMRASDHCSNYQEFTAQLRLQLEDSVKAHSLADVRVGAFLSGGLDSSAIVALLARQSSERLSTFTIGFNEGNASEHDAARKTADLLGIDHHEYRLTGEEVARSLPSILARMDQPTGDGINTYFVSRFAAEAGVKVVMSGLGGDELFGGYPSFRQVPRVTRLVSLWRHVPSPLRKVILAGLRRQGEGRASKLADFLGHARDLYEVVSLNRMVFAEKTRLALLSPEAREAAASMGPFHQMLEHFAADLHGASPLKAISAWETRTYMTDVLLSDSDVFSMANSIELRTPFVDAPLSRWLWHQPDKFVYTPGRIKGALSDAVADLLPAGTRERPKTGFSLPFAHWMRGPLRPFLDQTFSASSLRQCPLLDAPAVRSLWDDYLTHNHPRNWSRVWSLAMLVAFMNRRIAS